jgi:hypothetical protein
MDEPVPDLPPGPAARGSAPEPSPYRPGFHPFWFWNDRLTAEEVRRQVREMAAQGIRGFHIHPRQGLAQPYLSESFLDMVEEAVAEAARAGLAVHLYDEYPYPSGVAGGQVVLGEPRYQATRLVQRRFDLDGGPVRLPLPRGRVLACVAFPLEAGGAVRWDAPLDLLAHVGTVLGEESFAEVGLTPYNRKRYFASDPVPVLEATLPAGPHRLSVSVQAQVEDHKYWGRFADVLDPAAVREFLRRTHERYAARLGHLFGAAVVSIFADETAPGWSAALPEAYRARHGEDLAPLLPALHEPAHPDHLRVAAAVQDLRYDLFCAAFEAPIAAWCRAHGLRYTAEKPVLRLAQLRWTDLPGCDAGHVKAGAPLDLLQPRIRGNARAAASAAYLYGKEGALCECYHSLGWAATLQDAKRIADGLVLLGVDRLVPHAFFYSTHALRKHDAPPSFFFQMPFWPLFHHLAAHVEALTGALAGTHIEARLLVVEPAAGLPDRDDLRGYERLLDLLMARHIEFLLVDTDALTAARLAADAGGTRVCIRDVRAAAVLVPPMQVPGPALESWLRQAEEAGLPVIRVPAGEAPAGLGERLVAAAPPSLRIAAVGGGPGAGVWATARAGGGRRVWMVLNTAAEPVDLTLQPEPGVALREVSLDPDLPPALAVAPEGYRRRLAAFEACVVCSAGPPDAGPAVAPGTVGAPLPIRLRGPMTVRTDRPNVLRLGGWDLEVDDGAGGPPEGPRPVRAAPVANQLAEAGLRLRPSIAPRFGLAPHVALPHLRLRYTTLFESAYDGPVALVLEPDSLGGSWRISVNGAASLRAADLRPTAGHVPGTLGADISAAVRRGGNRLVVEVETDRADGGLRNPLYLAGDFGVALRPARLVPRPADAPPLDWDAAGLPHFAGVAEWRGTWTPPPEASTGGSALGELLLPPGVEDACEVSVGGGPWEPALWSPRLIHLAPERLGLGAGGRGDGRDPPAVGPVPIAVRVYTSLVRAFEGERFDTAGHRYAPV